MEIATLTAIAARYNNQPHCVLQMLRQVQATYSYVPEEAIQFYAKHLDLPISQVRVASSFTAFCIKLRAANTMFISLIRLPTAWPVACNWPNPSLPNWA